MDAASAVSQERNVLVVTKKRILLLTNQPRIVNAKALFICFRIHSVNYAVRQSVTVRAVEAFLKGYKTISHSVLNADKVSSKTSPDNRVTARPTVKKLLGENVSTKTQTNGFYLWLSEEAHYY